MPTCMVAWPAEKKHVQAWAREVQKMVLRLGQALVRVDGNDVDGVGAWTDSCERALGAVAHG